MTRNWTFGQKIGAGFALIVALCVITGIVSTLALRHVVASKDRVITVIAENLTNAQRLAVAASRKSSAVRGYLLSPEDRQLELIKTYRGTFSDVLAEMRRRTDDREALKLLAEIEQKEAAHELATERLVALKKSNVAQDQLVATFDRDLQPRFDELIRPIDAFTALGRRELASEAAAATQNASELAALTFGICAAAVLLAVAVALMLTRALGRQIGTAVAQVQSSSAELQLAANQQATAAKEQATAMTEITTTISELLATSRQIADSAQRVAQIAEQTASSARSGDATVTKAQESIAAIRRQVDLIVSHMLDLGKKSQQIGSVLDIVSELAEQTNILAINATIEAAGAGDAGKRFAVVADEIRKLADRVAGSTKEVRSLIEDVRSSVNTTIMTTETGSKAVDSGSRQFLEFASAFKQIAGAVGTTTEAAREIELSTKQQATAVEQVNVAVTNVAQATRETEVSSSQTLQTASQLSGLSGDLLRLVQKHENAAREAAARAA